MARLFERGWLAALAALLIGALTTLTFAPFDLWWLGPLLCAPLFGLLRGTSLRRRMLLGYSYGIGLFGTGTSWVYVSIHDFGNATSIEASLLTLVFVLGIALFYLIITAFYRLVAPRPSCMEPLTFAAVWTLGEVFRGWFLTGFPWLYLGSAHVSSPLSSYAPVGGVFLISFFVALSGALLWQIIANKRFLLLAPLVIIWGLGALLPTQWLKPDTREVTVALVQGDLPQAEKWTFAGVQQAANTYLDLTREHAGNANIVIWPEAALPMTLDNAMPVFATAQSNMKVGSTLISGIITQKGDRFFNSAVAFDQHDNGGMTTTQYDKYRLVPFGEYVPLESILRGMMSFFNLPTSHMSQGASHQPALNVDLLKAGIAICYEIVYPDRVRDQARQSQVLITISNDSWFGHSIGPLQHMQMAQMRALENNRYLLRGTNNGLTGVVAPDGHLLSSLPRFEPGVLNATVHPIDGETLFTRTGSLPIIVITLILTAIGATLSRRKSRM